MIRYFIEKAQGKFSFLKPELVVSVPGGITSTERRAVIEAATSAGAKSVYLVKEQILAAIGAGIPINSSEGAMIIDIGGGTSGIAVISLGGIVTSHSIRVAGDKMDEKIAEFIKKKHNLAIGTQTAERIKIKIGRATTKRKEDFYEIRGRELTLGLPKNIRVSSNEIAQALEPVLKEIISAVKYVLRETPPELSADIMDKGMILSGGGGLLRDLNVLIAKETGVPCFVAQEALYCVVKGTGVVVENLDDYKRSVMSKK